MNPQLNYLPVYFGLFAAQTLALACNAFLDIQYGGFGTEVLLWAAAFGITLQIGWRQNGEITEGGKRWMRRSLIFGALISVLLFVPMWGFPRAGLYMLAMLQVSYNCITTTRRHMYLGILISVVMVLFAASHYRADWTMLFYLVPYVTAVVFTLVAEQINRKTSVLREHSLGNQVVGAQGVAIVAATAVILALGLLLYALTPQVTWISLAWRWGQAIEISPGHGAGPPSSGGTQQKESNGGSSGTASNGSGAGSARPGWPTVGEMRRSAKRRGMPEWQRDAINGMADLTEKLEAMTKPTMQSLEQIWEALRKWLQENRDKLIKALIIAGILALLYAMWRLMREARMITWLRTRFDYLRLALLGMHRGDVHGAQACYEAMARLFELHEIERDSHLNAMEYSAEISSYYRQLSKEIGEMTRLYEDARYGGISDTVRVNRMCELYRQIFKLATN